MTKPRKCNFMFNLSNRKTKLHINRKETYGVSCCELAPLHQAVERGLEDHVFGRNFLLLHPFCRQLLEELRVTVGEKRQAGFSHMRHACVFCWESNRTGGCCTQTCMLGSCGAPGGTCACSWGCGASTGNPITGAMIGAGGV